MATVPALLLWELKKLRAHWEWASLLQQASPKCSVFWRTLSPSSAASWRTLNGVASKPSALALSLASLRMLSWSSVKHTAPSRASDNSHTALFSSRYSICNCRRPCHRAIYHLDPYVGACDWIHQGLDHSSSFTRKSVLKVLQSCIAPIIADQSAVKVQSVTTLPSGERVIVDPGSTIQSMLMVLCTVLIPRLPLNYSFSQIYYWSVNVGAFMSVATR
jgi:hypothetical protein